MPEEIMDNSGVMVESFSSNAFAGEFTLKANALMGNATTTLRKDEWIKLDDELLDVQLKWMAGIADLYAYGLDIQNGGLGTITHEYETVSDLGDADVNMTGAATQVNDKVEFGLEGVPVPIIGKQFKIDKRKLESSRMRGESLDTTMVRVAGRKSVEKLEDILFNGHSTKVDGRSIYGYTTFPSRNQVTLLLDWGTTPANIETDIRTLLAAADGVNRRGPFIIYVSKTEWSYLRKMISTTGDTLNTYYKAMINLFAEIIDIKVSFALATGNVCMVQMDKDTVDLSVGQELTTLEMSTKFLEVQMMVFQAKVPRIKVDANSTSGVFHGTSA